MGFLKRLFAQEPAPEPPEAAAPAPEPPRLAEPDTWPELPDPQFYGERDLASLDCPYCGIPLDSPPKAAKRKCPHCGELIVILKGPDERRHMMRGQDRETVQAEWRRERERRQTEAEDFYARVGILRGDAIYLSARGTGHYQAALERIARDRGDRFQCVVRLVREPSNPKSPHAIRVELYGEQVGYAVADEFDRDDVLDLLIDLERQGKHAWLPAEVQRSKGNGKLYLELGWLPTAEELGGARNR